MIIFWRGAGILVILLGILMCLLMNIITSAVFHQNDYFQTHTWAQVAALWGAAVPCWFIGRHLHRKPGRTLIDKQTGQEVHVKPSHHLMFIKLEYWGIILFIIGNYLLIAR